MKPPVCLPSHHVNRARPDWRRAAMLVLLGVAIGPGLLANALFKDHWLRPRPRELHTARGHIQPPG